MSQPEYLQDYLGLHRSTAECDEGPEISMRPGLLTVRYDTESDTGKEWTTLRFPGAVALRVTPELATKGVAVKAYSKVAVVMESAWLAEMSGNDGRLPHELKHFVVFFDHYGSIEAIALECNVQG
jgi:hypothetical protein